MLRANCSKGQDAKLKNLKVNHLFGYQWLSVAKAIPYEGIVLAFFIFLKVIQSEV